MHFTRSANLCMLCRESVHSVWRCAGRAALGNTFCKSNTKSKKQIKYYLKKYMYRPYFATHTSLNHHSTQDPCPTTQE